MALGQPGAALPASETLLCPGGTLRNAFVAVYLYSLMLERVTAMTTPRPEILLGDLDREQMPLSLATEGVLRYVWQSAFGPMLIEVRDGLAFVNGQKVTPIEETERADAGGAGDSLRRSRAAGGR